MKTPRNRGSALLLALLLVAVVGVLTAGWLSLVTARANYVEQLAAATKRRVAYENSRSLASEFLLERLISSTSGTAATFALADPTWGAITVPAWSSAPLLSVEAPAGVNLFSPGNGDGYTFVPNDNANNYILLGDGISNTPSIPRKFQLRSRSPLLSGTLLVSQTPTLTPSATVAFSGLDTAGLTFLWTYPTSIGLTSNSYTTLPGVSLFSILSLGGNTVLMNNLALPRQIANPRTGGASFYAAGQFDALDNSNPAANSSRAKVTTAAVNGLVSDNDNSDGVTCTADPLGLLPGTVTVTLDNPALGNVLITGNVLTLNLVGQSTYPNAAADDLPAILILIDQSSGVLPIVNLSLQNSRRVILAVKSTAAVLPLVMNFTAISPSWRLLLELENVPVNINAIGFVSQIGGIRSDRSVLVVAGSVRILPENDPKFLGQLATRTAWVESVAP
ncbi:MAG TPA: hypothetical protein VIM61_03985 [Chthoniobacterales bacterium]|jgi:hypothetical protein